jgi:hypothetical protein
VPGGSFESQACADQRSKDIILHAGLGSPGTLELVSQRGRLASNVVRSILIALGV